MNVRFLASFALAAALVVPPAVAQCGVDDGFQGPCCAIASPTFPVFPTMTVSGLGGSLLNCSLDCSWTTTISISPVQVLCDYWIMPISILGGTAADPSIPGGMLLAKYARTWTELAPGGPLQVWRWLVNMDAVYALSAAGGGPPCKVPFSALPPTSLPVHYMGHVDYAQNCATGTWEVSVVLTHLCPTESHAPWSARPLPLPAGLGMRTYHFVAPANFVFGPCAAPDGPIFAESVRSSQIIPGTPYLCRTEDPIFQGNLSPAFQDCACGTTAPPGGTPIYHHQNLFALAGACGIASPTTSLPVPGILPTGLRMLSIGSWIATTTGPTYPGPECVGVYTGILIYSDVCGMPASGPLHAVMGVGNVGGFPMVPFAPNPVATAFIESVDLANMLIFPTLAPGLGALFVSDRVWSFNTL
ncbi:MAG TPA: hypothetical protein VEI02_14780 [Planctomycetota bacterium]|nr:hypothetical protein [Planctomycetota bacterium]